MNLVQFKFCICITEYSLLVFTCVALCVSVQGKSRMSVQIAMNDLQGTAL